MKLSTECIPCLLKRVAYEVELSSPEKVMDALRECSKITTEHACEEISSAEFATEVHLCAYSMLDKNDPYEQLKRGSNAIAIELLPTARKYVEGSKRSFQAAMRVSIVGNLLDFGIAGSLVSPETLKKEFKRLIEEPVERDDSMKIERLLKKVDEVYFLADNCGEIVFDKLLLEKIKEIGKRIILVIKGTPILTDVTEKELEGLGVKEMVDEIIETEGLAIGMDTWSGKNGKLISRLEKADLIISKGMANFESLSEHEWKNIAYLLRVKCDPVARALGVKKDTSAIRLIHGARGGRS